MANVRQESPIPNQPEQIEKKQTDWSDELPPVLCELLKQEKKRVENHAKFIKELEDLKNRL